MKEESGRTAGSSWAPCPTTHQGAIPNLEREQVPFPGTGTARATKATIPFATDFQPLAAATSHLRGQEAQTSPRLQGSLFWSLVSKSRFLHISQLPLRRAGMMFLLTDHVWIPCCLRDPVHPFLVQPLWTTAEENATKQRHCGCAHHTHLPWEARRWGQGRQGCEGGKDPRLISSSTPRALGRGPLDHFQVLGPVPKKSKHNERQLVALLGDEKSFV